MSLAPSFRYGLKQHACLLSRAFQANEANYTPPVVDVCNMHELSEFTGHLVVEDHSAAFRVPKAMHRTGGEKLYAEPRERADMVLRVQNLVCIIKSNWACRKLNWKQPLGLGALAPKADPVPALGPPTFCGQHIAVVVYAASARIGLRR
ncbi:MAG: hypothetical protein CEE38_14165 [Planctomycetes bacterium B3_Pla]|nr:MAG: hypothetical protein CEE38_14165 [Planctomycetes bacterium B3_Pla]